MPIFIFGDFVQMTLTQAKALLFDLDGTLIDSTADLAASGNYLRKLQGMPPLDLDTVASYIGNGVQALVSRLLQSEDEVLIENSVRSFIHHYHEHCLDQTRLYDGVEETLRALHQAGYALAVVTNKPERISAHIIEGLGLSSLFGAIIGGNSAAAKKPDPQPLALACERLGHPLQSAVMIGDSHVDVQAARNAEIPCVAVTGGIGDPEKLHQAGADHVVEQFGALLSLFSRPSATEGV